LVIINSSIRIFVFFFFSFRDVSTGVDGYYQPVHRSDFIKQAYFSKIFIPAINYRPFPRRYIARDAAPLTAVLPQPGTSQLIRTRRAEAEKSLYYMAVFILTAL
jgi:hypothetical protein